MGQTLQSFGWQGSGGGSGGGSLKNTSFFLGGNTSSLNWSGFTRVLIPTLANGSFSTSSSTTPNVAGKALINQTIPNYGGQSVSKVTCTGTLRLTGTIASGARMTIDLLRSVASDGDTSLNFTFVDRTSVINLDNSSGGINLLQGEIDLVPTANQMLLFAFRNADATDIGTGLVLDFNLRLDFS